MIGRESMSFKSVMVALRRALVVTTMGLVGCTAARGTVLELKYTGSLKVVDATDSSRPRITISGRVKHSALGVRSIESDIRGDTIDVTVYLVLAGSRYLGEFSHDVLIPASVNEVRFGEQRALIWKRGQSPQ
jgi:hypothetical protein